MHPAISHGSLRSASLMFDGDDPVPRYRRGDGLLSLQFGDEAVVEGQYACFSGTSEMILEPANHFDPLREDGRFVVCVGVDHFDSVCAHVSSGLE